MKFSDDSELDLTASAIAVFESAEELEAATQELEGKGYQYYVLEGESGQRRQEAGQSAQPVPHSCRWLRSPR